MSAMPPSVAKRPSSTRGIPKPSFSPRFTSSSCDVGLGRAVDPGMGRGQGHRVGAPSLDDLAAATAASRDRVVDFLRAASIIAVVFGHWFIGMIVWRGGILTTRSAVGVTSGLWLATWLFQVMPIFFSVGGFSYLPSLDAARGRGHSRWAFVPSPSTRVLLRRRNVPAPSPSRLLGHGRRGVGRSPAAHDPALLAAVRRSALYLVPGDRRLSEEPARHRRRSRVQRLSADGLLPA